MCGVDPGGRGDQRVSHTDTARWNESRPAQVPPKFWAHVDLGEKKEHWPLSNANPSTGQVEIDVMNCMRLVKLFVTNSLKIHGDQRDELEFLEGIEPRDNLFIFMMCDPGAFATLTVTGRFTCIRSLWLVVPHGSFVPQFCSVVSLSLF